MPVLTRYEIGCEVFTGRGMPYTDKITYFTGSPYKRQHVSFDHIDGEHDVISEFWRKSRETAFRRFMNDVYEISVVQGETADVKEVRDEPSELVELFFERESFRKTYTVPDNTTQIFIDQDKVYMWSEDSMLQIEGRRLTPLVKIQPVVLFQFDSHPITKKVRRKRR